VNEEGSVISRGSLEAETIEIVSGRDFFRRYIHLSGMTGTAKEARGEFRAVYGLSMAHIPTHRKLHRVKLPDRVFETVVEKWQAVVDRILALYESGCPVLVGTRSVAASEHLSALLEQAGLVHRVLNAKFDQDEAEIIAQAGECARITIATNMAGRGTDIRLQGSAQKMGLYVILTERHEAGRIDRQLAGRCGRQGDPGFFQTFVSMEDPLIQDQSLSWAYRLTCSLLRTRVGKWLGGYFIRKAQRKMEGAHGRVRHDLLKMDEQRNELLAFSGRSE
ncbi:MAG: prepilin peptidase, partial [Candidatus Latescibacteria bacterium]|nr:prepilin peptidase [Candidatus Latescibacterota bacterium]